MSFKRDATEENDDEANRKQKFIRNQNDTPTIPRNLSDELNHKRFDPKVPYISHMYKMRIHFEKEWRQLLPSVSTGLAGFEFIQNLGAGAYGTVSLYSETKFPEKLYAVKRLTKAKIIITQHLNYILNEKRVLACVDFPFLMQLAVSRKDNDYLYFILPFLSGGTLFHYLRTVTRIDETQAKFYAMQVFLAIDYLHYMNIVHRDIKPENIIFATNGYIKLTDYGFSKKLTRRHTSSFLGTTEYMSPELISMQPYTKSVDWWAFGILIYEMVHGTSPFISNAGSSSTNETVYDKILAGKIQMSNYFSAILVDLLTEMLKKDINTRLGCKMINGNSDIKLHVWFNEINWFSILNQEFPAPYIPAPMEINKKQKEQMIHKSKMILYEDEFQDF